MKRSAEERLGRLIRPSIYTRLDFVGAWFVIGFAVFDLIAHIATGTPSWWNVAGCSAASLILTQTIKQHRIRRLLPLARAESAERFAKAKAEFGARHR